MSRYLPVLLLLLGLGAFFALGGDRYLDLNYLQAHQAALKMRIAQNFFVSALLYFLLYVLLVMFSVPGAIVMTVAGGYFFGWIAGGMLTVTAASTGAVIVFLAARYAFREVFEKRAGAWLKKLETGFRAHEFSYLMSLRLVPIFPFFVVNVVPAFLGISLRNYALGTIIGIIPGSLVYSLLGSGLDQILARDEPLSLNTLITPELWLAFLGLGGLALAPVMLRKWRVWYRK